MVLNNSQNLNFETRANIEPHHQKGTKFLKYKQKTVVSGWHNERKTRKEW